MRKEKPVPNAIKVLTESLFIAVCDFCTEGSDNDKFNLIEFMAREISNLVERQTAFLQDRILAFDERQSLFDPKRPAVPTANPAPDRKADRHGVRTSPRPTP